MGELFYSILRYEPSIVSGEIINLGAAFYYPDADYREFFSITKWNRVSAFDDTLNIPLMKDLMLDIRDAMGTHLDTPDFNLKKFCAKYNSELYFDECMAFTDIRLEEVSDHIEEIKKMYFQFEYDIANRPNNDAQKKFLRRLLVAKSIDYVRNSPQPGAYGDIITYDFTFGSYGVVFINLNNDKIDNKTMNKVRAWAWNAQNSSTGHRLIVLYDLEDESRNDVQPALSILRSTAHRIINIHNGFNDVSSMLDDVS